MKYKLIIRLRKETGISIMKCKEILNKFNWDFNSSLKYLKNNKIYENNNSKNLNGLIYSGSSKDNKYSCIFKLKCDTDFVSSNENLINFAKNILSFCLNNKISNIHDINNKFKNDIINLRNIFKENVLIDNFKNIEDYFTFNYNYRNKISVILGLNKKINIYILKEICMNIIFYKPEFIYKENFIHKKYNSDNILEDKKSIINNEYTIKDIIIKNKININKFYVLYI